MALPIPPAEIKETQTKDNKGILISFLFFKPQYIKAIGAKSKTADTAMENTPKINVELPNNPNAAPVLWTRVKWKIPKIESEIC